MIEAIYLHPAALQRASGANESVQLRRKPSYSHPDALGWKLTLLLEEAVWRHQVGF